MAQINILNSEKGELQGQLKEKDKQIEKIEQKKGYKQKQIGYSEN